MMRKMKIALVLFLTPILIIGLLLSFAGSLDAKAGAARSTSDSSGNVFLGGNYIEVGISKSGSFGTSRSAPASFGSHARSGGAVGLISDGDGWGVGNAPTTGDFFLPGTPEERYILGYYIGSQLYNYNVADRVNASTTSWKVAPTTQNMSSGDLLKAVTTGITAQNIRYTQTVEFDVNDKEFMTTILLENTGTSTIQDMRYVRSFDPDQDQYTQGTYNTYNKVISNPRTESYNKEKDVAMVVARGYETLDGFFFAAFDQRARASRGVAFSPNSAYMSGLWNANTGVPTEPTDALVNMTKGSLNGYTNEDNAIALTFSLGDMEPGAKTSFQYYSSLDPNVIQSITKLKAFFALVSANEKDHSIGPFEKGSYEINDGTMVYVMDIPTDDAQIKIQGTDKNGNNYNFTGKTISIVLKGDGATTEDSDPQNLSIPAQFNYEGVLSVDHNNVPESVRLAAAIIHLQMKDDASGKWNDIATNVVVFNKNKKTQSIPYSFPNLWVRWQDETKPDYEYRIVVDADNYSGANVPTTARDISISYTEIDEEKTKIERTTIVFDDNGGFGGTGAINLYDKKILPASIEVPVREGYDFKGYFKSFLEGTMYYDATGKKEEVDLYDRPWETAGDALAGYTLYANWEIHNSSVIIDPNGGLFAGELSYVGDYGESITLTNPTRSGYTFLRWVPSDDNCKLTETLNAYYYQFGAEKNSVTLKAVWYQDRQAQFEKKETVVENIECTKIDQVFKCAVTDTTKGITEDDFSKGEIVVKVSVDEASPEAGAPIQEMAAEDSETDQLLRYYDISVSKTVDGTSIGLTELPTTITVAIPLTGDLSNQNGYAIYRIHEGVTEKLSTSRNSSEYYEVIGDTLYIHTKKFSVYGVAALNSTIGVTEELTAENNNSNGNVYARYLDGSSYGVYKIDIAWGTMKYDFTKQITWNPEMHRYEYDISLDETNAYDGVNNKILVTNHSNADVRVSTSVSNSIGFDGIGIEIKTSNDQNGELFAPTDVLKVSDDTGSGLVSTVSGYVRLDAMLNVDSVSVFSDPDTYYQVGTITVRIEAIGENYTPMSY